MALLQNFSLASCSVYLCCRRFQTSRQNELFQGAFLKDPHTLFNAGLDAKKTRAIDFREGDAVDESALKDLICAAVAYNGGGKRG